jgi:hypothetical protein
MEKTLKWQGFPIYTRKQLKAGYGDLKNWMGVKWGK